MNDGDSNNVAAAAKKRLRREARIRENYDRISATLSLNDSKATRNPTRIIPDVPGFQILTKAEVKRDTKDIEKGSTFAQLPKEKNIAEEMEGLIQRSMRPHCAAESTLMKKKRRLVNWVNNPDVIEKDMLQAKIALQKAKVSLAAFETEKDEFLVRFQSARRLLSNALKAGIEHNKRLKSEGAQLLSLCEAECGYSLRKKRTFVPKDLVDELLKRENGYAHAVEEYITLAQELRKSGGALAAAVPIVTMTVDEVHYAEDDVYIRNKHSGGRRAVPPAACTTVDKAADSATSDTTTAPATTTVTASEVNKVKMPEDEGMEVDEEVAPRECVWDIPLPLFDHELKQVFPAPACRSTASTAESDQAGPRTRRRSGSFSGTSKLHAANQSATDLETASSSEGPGSVERTSEADSGSNPTSASSFSHGNWSPAATAAAHGNTAGQLLTDQSLLQLLCAVQEAVKLSEGMATDAEFMFQERVAPIDGATIIQNILAARGTANGATTIKTEVGAAPKTTKTAPALTTKGNKIGSSNGTGDAGTDAKSLAAPYLALSRSCDHEWSAFLDTLFDGLLAQGIVTRKGKKKGPEFLPVSVDPRLRTARGVNLMLSPLSQFEDRQIGVLHRDTIYQTKLSGGEVSYSSTVQLPAHLRRAEEDAMERLRLQSAAAMADVKLQRLRTSLKEVHRFAQEAQTAYRRAEQHHEVVLLEEAQDLRKMYKELLHYGILPPCPNDPPMSPITSNSATVAASLLQNSVYPANTNKPGAKNSRVPVRNASVTQQAPAPQSVRPGTTAPIGVAVDVSRVDSTASEGATTNETTSTSDVKSMDDAAAAEAESLKRKAATAAVTTTSAPKRRR